MLGWPSQDGLYSPLKLTQQDGTCLACIADFIGKWLKAGKI